MPLCMLEGNLRERGFPGSVGDGGVSSVMKNLVAAGIEFDEQEILKCLGDLLRVKNEIQSCPIEVVEVLVRCLNDERLELVNASLELLISAVQVCDVENLEKVVSDGHVFAKLIRSENQGAARLLLELAPFCPSLLMHVFSECPPLDLIQLCRTNANMGQLLEVMSFAQLPLDSAAAVVEGCMYLMSNNQCTQSAITALNRFLQNEQLVPNIANEHFQAWLTACLERYQSQDSTDPHITAGLLHLALISFRHCRTPTISAHTCVQMIQSQSHDVSQSASALATEMILADPAAYVAQFRDAHLLPCLCSTIKDAPTNTRRAAAHALAVFMQHAPPPDFDVLFNHITFTDLFEMFELDDVQTTILIMHVVKLSHHLLTVSSIPAATLDHVIDVLDTLADHEDPDVAVFAAALSMDIDRALEKNEMKMAI